MPPTETSPNPAPAAPPPTPEPVKVVTRRFGELDHTELVQLLDSLEGDQAKSRFRESIYISVIIYLIIGWLIVYGPRYIFHQGHVVPSAAELKEKNRLTQLEMNKDITKLQTPKVPKVAPKLDRRAIEQLQAMQRANEAAKAARQQRRPEAPQPAPTPAPAPPPTQAQTQPPPLPPAPTPQPLPRSPVPQASAAIPDAPRPNFSTPQTAGSSVGDAVAAAARQHSGGNTGERMGARVGQQGAGTGPVEILSDTQGVDFSDYIKHLLRMIKAAWLPLIPEECYPPLSKEGTTLIRFSIKSNGALDDMHLDGSTHDQAINKAAWGSITSIGQFPPLPAAFKGPILELRIQFIISRNPPNTE